MMLASTCTCAVYLNLWKCQKASEKCLHQAIHTAHVQALVNNMAARQNTFVFFAVNFITKRSHPRSPLITLFDAEQAVQMYLCQWLKPMCQLTQSKQKDIALFVFYRLVIQCKTNKANLRQVSHFLNIEMTYAAFNNYI